VDIFTTFLLVAVFCFTVVFWLKRGENKHRYQKTKMVDHFIEKNHIHVSKLYSGMYCDIINDTKNQSIWFFVLEQLTLKYKQIHYDDLFYVAYKLDGKPVEVASRDGQTKRQMLGGDGPNVADMPPLVRREDIKVVKEISLTIIVDDRHASVIDLLFVMHPFFADVNHVKDVDAKTWFNIFAEIIEHNEKKLLQGE